jgi:predicted DNA-binding protein (MmcQ/YjbR family)
VSGGADNAGRGIAMGSDRALQRLRGVCLALPEATEKETWGDPTWRVRDRIFAMQKGNYAGGRPSVWLKAPDGAQTVLVGADPERFFVPPYVGHKGWVGIYLDNSVDWDELSDLVEESYRLVAPRRLTIRLEARSYKRRDEEGHDEPRSVGAANPAGSVLRAGERGAEALHSA